MKPVACMPWASASVLSVLLTGCATGPPRQARVDCCNPSASQLSTHRVVVRLPYELNDSWESDTGAALRLAELRGKPRVIAMFFANCQGVCLLTLDHMKQMEESLPAEARGHVGFVLVTLDPARDTAGKLAAYRRENSLSAADWTILRGGARATADLAARLSITFSRESSRGFVHSSGMTVLDASGRVIEQQLGNHPDLPKMVKALASAANKINSPELTWQQPN